MRGKVGPENFVKKVLQNERNFTIEIMKGGSQRMSKIHSFRFNNLRMQKIATRYNTEPIVKSYDEPYSIADSTKQRKENEDFRNLVYLTFKALPEKDYAFIHKEFFEAKDEYANANIFSKTHYYRLKQRAMKCFLKKWDDICLEQKFYEEY